jgi:Thioredoxin like C-terminal domain
VGYEHAQHFASPAGLEPDQSKAYTLPAKLLLDQWALAGTWMVDEEKAVLQRAGGKIVSRFHARDLHLVLGPGSNGKPIRFRVILDRVPPGANHGVDVDPSGAGVVREQRLYQLIRAAGDVTDRTSTIEFLDADVQAYAFTFG